MKKLILVALLVFIAWWYFIGARKLSEDHVRDFYRNLEMATLDRKSDDLCALFADDFHSSGVVQSGSQRVNQEQNKEQTCTAYHELFDTWDKLGEKMGGLLQLDSHYEIHDIEISDDKKTATVDISTSLDVGGSIMNMKSRSTDTLIRRNGKVIMLHTKGTGSVSSG